MYNFVLHTYREGFEIIIWNYQILRNHLACLVFTKNKLSCIYIIIWEGGKDVAKLWKAPHLHPKRNDDTVQVFFYTKPFIMLKFFNFSR